MRRDAAPRTRETRADTLAVALRVPGYREFVFKASAVRVPAVDGELLIEPGHRSCETPLEVGPLTVEAGSRTWLAAVHGGRLRVDGDEVAVVADAIEFAERVDVERARAAQADAAEQLTRDRDDEAALAALRRANLRLAVAARVRS